VAESVLVSVLQSFVVWKVGYMYLFYLQATDGCELPGALPFTFVGNVVGGK
jgi:hypothetical protein